MTAQVLFFNVFFKKDPHLNAAELVLDSKLHFNEHVNNEINKCNKSIGIMKILSLTLPRNSLLNIYKTFVRPIVEYADITYDKPLTESFKDKLEMV